jgi:hypothetical protein
MHKVLKKIIPYLIYSKIYFRDAQVKSPTKTNNNEVDPLSLDVRWELSQRVAASSYFQKSPKLKDFLLFICERTLTGNSEEVREQQIGSRVFGRRVDYNPSEDNIVRVEARELRKRLESYFENEGAAEPLVITIPKGAYIPSFLARESAPELITVVGSEKSTPSPDSSGQQGISTLSASSHNYSLRGVALLLVVIVLSASCLWLWNTNHQLEGELKNSRSLGLPQGSIWNQLFDFNHQTYIVLSDTCLVMLLMMKNQQVSLEDYISRKYLALMNTPELKLISDRQYTDLADMNITSRIIQLGIAYRDRIVIRYARNAQPQDFKLNHLILLGSKDSNPWTTLFSKLQNFNFTYSPSPPRPLNKTHIFNKAPQGKEETYYLTGGKDGTSDDAYAIIAFLPNLNQNGNVLIIEGTNAEATEGAGEFITKPDFSQKLRSFLGLQSSDKPWPYFELLLRTNTLGGTTKETTYITHRIISPEKFQEVIPPIIGSK